MIRLIIWSKPHARYIFAAWILTILGVSSIPSVPTLQIQIAHTDIRLDYLIHFCEYGILALMAFLSFTNNEFKISSRKLFIITISLISFAVLDEVHQKLIPGRAFNMKDIMSNISGIVGALVFSIVVFRKIMQRYKKPD
ncbi:MAG TPA: VanZ family protein [Bacteroidales bacterium]|nr:VanZ family protein [Bacteroidales bacterium]